MKYYVVNLNKKALLSQGNGLMAIKSH